VPRVDDVTSEEYRPPISEQPQLSDTPSRGLAPATVPVDGGRRGGGRVRALARVPFRLLPFLRGILTELAVPAAAPLPPLSRPRRLNRLPHVVVCLIALGIGLAAMDELSDGYHLGFPLGTLSGFAVGAAVAFALWRPVPAWWLSLGATVVADVPGPAPGTDWPWSSSTMTAQAVVLLLLALRSPTRVAVGALSLTALATYALQGLATRPTYPPAALLGGPSYHPTGAPAVVVFATVVLLGTALRGRREARTQLVEQASLTEEERARRTVLEERSRIARELHDVVAHHMSVIAIQAEAAPYKTADPPPELLESFGEIRASALAGLAELRRVLGVLRTGEPGTAPQPGLAELDTLLDSARSGGVSVAVTCSGNPVTLPEGVDLSAYRIVQEALSNAMRHAPGARVQVQVAYRPDSLALEIRNDAVASVLVASGAREAGGGHGLVGMRERATMLGGSLDAGPTGDGGFRVAAVLPVSPPEEAAP